MFNYSKITKEEYRNATKGFTVTGSWVYDTGEAGDEEYALFWGRLQTVFGEANYQYNDWEDMYTYLIKAESADGKPLYLQVYHGSGGPSVALPECSDEATNALYKQASIELVSLIKSTSPTDYEWDSVYEDFSMDIKYIVKNGKAEVHSSMGKSDFDF